MFRVCTPKETVLHWIIEMAGRALINGEVKTEFEKYSRGTDIDYEKVCLELLQDLKKYPTDPELCGFVHCVHHHFKEFKELDDFAHEHGMWNIDGPGRKCVPISEIEEMRKIIASVKVKVKT